MKKIRVLIVILIWLLVIPFSINAYVILSTKNQIINNLNEEYDIGVILGCKVNNDEPSLMLKDRLDKGIELYQNGYIKKVLITGDSNELNNEVQVMYNYLINNEVKEEDILIDNYGFSTSESLINYEHNYSNQKGLIITQKYHLFRSIYIANQLHLNMDGVKAIKKSYPRDFFRQIREILARNKDFIKMKTNYWH